MKSDLIKKKVSVCMASYNGASFISKQIKSILAQLKDEDELVISDDSSSDKTLEIIRSFQDKRIKVISYQRFRSPIFNFENALKHSTGSYIFLSDQDDLWREDKVEKMVDALQNADLVVCDCSIINEDNEVIVTSFFESLNSSPGLIKNLWKNTYLGCCMAFKREVLKKALPFPKDIPMHDIWLGFITDLFFKPKFLNEQLTFYRKHDNNASTASDLISSKGRMEKIRFRINTLKYLPRLLFR